MVLHYFISHSSYPHFLNTTLPLPRMEGPAQLPYQDQSTPVEEGGRLVQPWPDTSAIQPVMSLQSAEDQASASARAAMEPWVSDVLHPASSTSTSISSSTSNSTSNSSSTFTSNSSYTSSRALRSQSSYMSLPDTGRPGSAQHTVTRVHCPQCNKFLQAKSMPRHMQTVHKSS